jgi:hypothetical protein
MDCRYSARAVTMGSTVVLVVVVVCGCDGRCERSEGVTGRWSGVGELCWRKRW